MKRIFIIGNAPSQESIAHLLNEQDLVVRFNHPSQESFSRYGTQTNVLFTINTWKFIQKRIHSNLINESWLQACNQVILAYHPNIIAQYHRKPSLFSQLLTKKKSDGSLEALAYFGQKFPVTFLSENFYLSCCNLLEINKYELNSRIPSTGFLAICYYLQNFPNHKIYIHGFSWEGWNGHSWDKEKQMIHNLLSEKKIFWAKQLLT